MTSALLASGSSRRVEISSVAPLCWSPTTAEFDKTFYQFLAFCRVDQMAQVGRTHLRCEPFSPARGPQPPVQACQSMLRRVEGIVQALAASHAGAGWAEASEGVGTKSRSTRACGVRGAVRMSSAVSRCTLRVVRVSATCQLASQVNGSELTLCVRRRSKPQLAQSDALTGCTGL